MSGPLDVATGRARRAGRDAGRCLDTPSPPQYRGRGRRRGFVMLFLAVLAAGVVLGGGVALLLGVRRNVRSNEELEALESKLAKANARTTFLARQLEVANERLEMAKEQRDEYARIAATHEVKLPELLRTPQRVTNLWKDRRYANHPEENLRDLRKDLSELGEQYVVLKLAMEYFGGWKKIMGGEPAEGAGDVTEPLRARRQLLFEGPASRVFQQIESFFRDDDHHFVVVGDDGQKTWADADSPLAWLVSADVVQGGKIELPDIHHVEVLRVQKEIEERVVERPVITNLPTDAIGTLDDETERQIINLIDAVLELRDSAAARAGSRAALRGKDGERTAAEQERQAERLRQAAAVIDKEM